MKGLFAFILMLCATTYGAQVLRTSESQWAVEITHGNSQNWKLQDYVCLHQKGGISGCGYVMFTDKRGAVVRLHTRPKSMIPIQLGATVAWAKPLHTPYEAAVIFANPLQVAMEVVELQTRLEVETEKEAKKIRAEEKANPPKLHVSAGVNINSVLGTVEVGVNRNLSVGASPNVYRLKFGNIQSTLTGVLVHLTYYPKRLWEGFWTQIGGGIYSASTEQTNGVNRQTAISLYALAGWKLGITKSMTASFGGGVQYLHLKPSKTQDTNRAKVDPSARFELGIRF